MKYNAIIFALLFVFFNNTKEVKSQSIPDINEVVNSVRMLCNDELGFSQIIKIDGDIDLGGKLRIFGVGADASISRSDYKNLHNLYEKTRYDPVKCRFEMLASIERIFFSSREEVDCDYPSTVGDFSSHAGPGSATASSATHDGSTSCYSGPNNPGPCVAPYRSGPPPYESTRRRCYRYR